MNAGVVEPDRGPAVAGVELGQLLPGHLPDAPRVRGGAREVAIVGEDDQAVGAHAQALYCFYIARLIIYLAHSHIAVVTLAGVVFGFLIELLRL